MRISRDGCDEVVMIALGDADVGTDADVLLLSTAAAVPKNTLPTARFGLL